MIGTLKRKFVMTAMLAITVLLLSLLGVLNLANLVAVEKDIDRTLSMISEYEGSPNNIPMDFEAHQDRPASEAPMKSPENKYDTFMASTFFVVLFDGKGDIVYVDTSRTSSVTEDAAKELAKEVLLKDDFSGKNGKYRYMVRTTVAENGTSVVFLDISAEMHSFFRIMFLSGVIGLVCWGLMLVFVILLSNRAIRPIAENIEKQRQFVTNAGHEIRTPLAIIQSNTEAMELYIGENKWSKNIKEQTVRLGGLMKNLLLLARMDEGGAEANVSDFLLSDLLAGMIQGVVQPMEMKAINLRTGIRPDVFLRADKEQIEQLISILSENALKYANKGGDISVCLRKEERQILLQFQNTCEALPSVPSDRLFDRFYRADEARSQKNGGYGIGLSVAKSIVAGNKGSIAAEYAQPNSICFTIRFCE